jgi:hypothetical protein
MEKRGTHIGIIASFSVFILFLVGLYVIMNPIKGATDKELIMNYVEGKLLEDFSGNLTVALIKPNSTGCMSVNYRDIGVNEDINSIVKDKDNNVIDSEKHGSSLFIKDSSENLYWIYYSYQDFYNTAPVSGNCYSPIIASVRETKEIFEEKIINRINNFPEFKDSLNINSQAEFSFSFEMDNKTTIEVGAKNTTLEVFAKEFPIQYYDNKANKLNGIIKIKVW